mmetsp:Transcript_6032/g.6918  ORF Transcript_6032/g.6918 Transcript_6032/m.6918 type:complete len:99 (+) Transcript_6032:53-349(+)
MSSHCLMTILVALLLAFIARTSAEEASMNVRSVATSNDTSFQSKALLRGTVNRSAVPFVRYLSPQTHDGYYLDWCATSVHARCGKLWLPLFPASGDWS